MKTQTIFFAVLLALAAFVGGLVVGRHGAKTKPPEPEPIPAASVAIPDAKPLPPVKTRSRTTAEPADKSAKRMRALTKGRR